MQRKNGFVAFHVLGSLYLFVALAVVCDKYFVPAVDRICQALNMSSDVAGATFMVSYTHDFPKHEISRILDFLGSCDVST